VMLTREGQDTKLSENRFELGQRFCNKIWNATRFALGNLDGVPEPVQSEAFEDRWIESRLHETIRAMSAALTEYRFHDGAQELYRFFWNDFCDWYLELVKRRMDDGADPADRAAARSTLASVLSASIRLMHPYLPFLTEELWRYLPGTEGQVIRADWPDAAAFRRDENLERDFELLRDTVAAVRNVRSAMNVPPGARIRLLVKAEDPDLVRVLHEAGDLLGTLARLEDLTVGTNTQKPAGAASAVIRGGTLYVPLEGVIDLGVERERLHKERDRLTSLIGGAEKKLSNENFVSRAKPEVVEREREKLDSLRGDLEKVDAALADLA
jgi:valyl-tRNA synthetase